jgi:ferredoxin
MAGISDKALKSNYAENKYRFQKQELQNKEFSDGSGLEMYEFKYRMDDPQIGRFWSVDPLASKYVYNSPYSFSEDKVTGDVELEGLEGVPFGTTMFRSVGITSSTDPKEFVTQVAKEAAKPQTWAMAYGVVGGTLGAATLVGIMTGGTGEGAVMESEMGAARGALTDEGAAALQQRADDIHATLGTVTQDKVTTAVGLATTADGNNVTLVASSEKVLRPAQIAALQPGEVAVSGVGHAEATIMNYADKTGMSVQAVAANRPICTSCAVSVASGGAQAVTPYKNPAQAITAINAFNASLPIPLTSK